MVYVCYINYGSYEGNSAPIKVFYTEDKAIKWVGNHYNREYEELIIE